MNLLPRSGLMLEPQLGQTLQQTVETTQLAEKLGYGYVFRSDHLLATNRSRIRDSSECWTSMGVLVAETTRIKLGTLVTPVGFRNPALVAEMACTLHDYSRGRVLLGLGAGWFKDEYDAYGYGFPGLRVRVDQLREAVHLVKPLLDGERTDFQGKYFSAHTECFPKPKGKIPLIIGGRNPRVVQLAATEADEWDIYSPTEDEFVKLRKLLDQKSRGRNVEVSKMCGFFVAGSPSGLRRVVERHMKLFGMSGEPEKAMRQMRSSGSFVGVVDEFVSQVNGSLQSGIDRIYFELLNPGDRELTECLAETLKTKF